jgi:hypothetical protein
LEGRIAVARAAGGLGLLTSKRLCSGSAQSPFRQVHVKQFANARDNDGFAVAAKASSVSNAKETHHVRNRSLLA